MIKRQTFLMLLTIVVAVHAQIQWREDTTVQLQGRNYLTFCDSTFIISSSSDTLLFSGDGSFWEAHPVPGYFQLHSLTRSLGKLYALDREERLCVSLDNGRSWAREELFSTDSFVDIGGSSGAFVGFNYAGEVVSTRDFRRVERVKLCDHRIYPMGRSSLIAVNDNGALLCEYNRTYYSHDLINWHETGFSVEPGDFYNHTPFRARWVVATDSHFITSYGHISEDPAHWSTPKDWSFFLHSPHPALVSEGIILILDGQSGVKDQHFSWASPDGAKWTRLRSSSFPSNYLGSPAVGNGVIVAINSENRIVTSPLLTPGKELTPETGRVELVNGALRYHYPDDTKFVVHGDMPELMEEEIRKNLRSYLIGKGSTTSGMYDSISPFTLKRLFPLREFDFIEENEKEWRFDGKKSPLGNWYCTDQMNVAALKQAGVDRNWVSLQKVSREKWAVEISYDSLCDTITLEYEDDHRDPAFLADYRMIRDFRNFHWLADTAQYQFTCSFQEQIETDTPNNRLLLPQSALDEAGIDKDGSGMYDFGLITSGKNRLKLLGTPLLSFDQISFSLKPDKSPNDETYRDEMSRFCTLLSKGILVSSDVESILMNEKVRYRDLPPALQHWIRPPLQEDPEELPLLPIDSTMSEKEQEKVKEYNREIMRKRLIQKIESQKKRI